MKDIARVFKKMVVDVLSIKYIKSHYGYFYIIAKNNLNIAKNKDFYRNKDMSPNIEYIDSCNISILFSAITIEAFINDYGFTYLGETCFKRLDKLSIKQKWIIIPKMVTGKYIGEENELNFISSHYFEKLTKLFKLRDKMVHPKANKMTIGNEIDDIYNLIFKAKDSLETVNILVSALKKIDEKVDIEWLKADSSIKIKSRKFEEG